MKALVLAGGKGVRMMPLTIDKPKVLIPVGKKPFISYVLENLKKAGFMEKDIYVVVSYQKDKVIKYFEEEGYEVNVIDQGEILGTGHAVLKTERWVKDNFVLVMGDNLYSAEDINKMMNDDDLFYIAGFESTHPQDYGVLDVKNSKLLRIDEKPSMPKSRLVNTGLYKLTPEIFKVLKTITKSPRGEYELTDALNMLAAEGKVRVVKLKDYWIDMSTTAKLPQTEKEVLSVMR